MNGARSSADRLAALLEPRKRFGPALLTEQGRDRPFNISVVRVEPLELSVGQQLHGDELALDWEEGTWSERHERRLACSSQLGLVLGHNLDHVLDSDSKRLILIISGLDRHNHPGFERGLERGCPGRDPDGPLVHVQKRPHAMAGAVAVVKPSVPQAAAGKRVNQNPRGALGESQGRQRDVTLEDPGEALPFVFGRRRKVHGACDVSGAVKVLSTRIEQVQRVDGHVAAATLVWMVVDDGPRRPGRRDGGERRRLIPFLLRPKLLQPHSSRPLRRPPPGRHLPLHPEEKLAESNRVPTVAPPHPVELHPVLHCLCGAHRGHVLEQLGILQRLGHRVRVRWPHPDGASQVTAPQVVEKVAVPQHRDSGAEVLVVGDLGRQLLGLAVERGRVRGHQHVREEHRVVHNV
mmetsp:Transcript_30114/g.90198  ORF Transcript_30114/g.90198 Transcript_30114/m.90198 type:complete len:406 (+) Transcript_30114:60-1277(+)